MTRLHEESSHTDGVNPDETVRHNSAAIPCAATMPG
jgi:hypothetical protein